MMTVVIDGSGVVEIGGNASSAAYVRLYEDSDNGTNYVDLIAPTSVAANRTQTLADVTGTLAPIVSGTAVASTSGTSIDFTDIPSWAKRITVMFSGVSTNGTSIPLIQLGDSGGIETTGYAGAGGLIFAGFSAYASNFTDGFGLSQTGQWASNLIVSGSATIALVNLPSNLWVCNGWFAREDAAATHFTGGKKSLSGTLDRVRITTANGTDTFDAGTINILYE
jgi:hypothetical protein